MNIGLLIRGVKAGAKLAKSGAKATARGTKSAAKATARKAKSGARATAKAVGKNKVVRGASRVGGKVAEGVGYAATSGLKRGKTGRYFKGGGSKPIQSISKAKVRSTGKKVIGGAAAIGTGYGTTKTVKSKRAKAAAAKAKRDAAAAKARSKVSSAPKKTKPKTVNKPTKKSLPAYARLSSPKPTKPKSSLRPRSPGEMAGGKGSLRRKLDERYRNSKK
tara:strand:- start:1205 stop:1861 length:657 start_codon:yes stop_codon:yes gene_type:complete